MLFGEHTVVKGSQALAMPINSHYGTWQYVKDPIQKQIQQQNLPQFGSYLNEQNLSRVLDITTFLQDMDQGLYFQSSIPTGYGMGSSGALCAAIFDQYKQQDITDLGILKQLFGKMESFFHGTSSGMDPLVCFLNYPILFSSNGAIQQVQIDRKQLLDVSSAGTSDRAIFLLDTHIQRETAPYVNGFLERCKKEYYNKKCTDELVPVVNTAIASLTTGKWEALQNAWSNISFLQQDLFDFMIPTPFRKIWQLGLESDVFKLKICGAGGGGYLLGICENFEATKSLLRQDLIRII